MLETVNNTTENPDTALDLNPRPIHFQRGALGGSAESLDASTDPSRDEVVEVMEVKPQSRPLERARARYAARMGRARLRSDPTTIDPYWRSHVE